MIALYYRVSSERQVEANSVDAQRFALKCLFASRGWDYEGATEFVDEGLSGATAERPGYQALLAQIELGAVRTVCVYDMDRVTRDADERIRFIRLCAAAGVELIQCTGEVKVDTPEGMFMQRIIAAVKEMERNILSRRTKAGIRAYRARGEKWGGQRLKVGARGGRVLTDAQAQEAARRKEAGETLAAIARDFGCCDLTLKRSIVRVSCPVNGQP